jgi:hypothetical protein
MDIEQPADPMRTCAYSGVQKPESQMVRIGGHWVAAEHKDACVQFLQQGGDLGSQLLARPGPPTPQLWPMLRRSWDLCRSCAGLLIGIHLTVAIPENLLWSFVDVRVTKQMSHGPLSAYSLFWFALLLPIASGIISSVGSAAMIAALSRLWAGTQPDYGASWRATSQRAASILLAAFLSMFIIMPGIFLCIIPGVVAMVRLTFYECFIMDAGHTGPQSMGSSSRLTQGRFWLVLGCMLLVTVATILPISLTSAVVDLLFRENWEAQGAFRAILSVPVIYLTVFTFVFYKALQEQAPTESNAPA